MDRIFAIITIFILLSTNLLADRINNIEINGNKRISQETIKVYGEIEVNKEYLEEDLNKILINEDNKWRFKR